jgi:hypothetical protein
MVEVLYPAEDNDHPLVKRVALVLKPYVKAITDPATRAHAHASVLGLVTKPATVAAAARTQVRGGHHAH